VDILTPSTGRRLSANFTNLLTGLRKREILTGLSSASVGTKPLLTALGLAAVFPQKPSGNVLLVARKEVDFLGEISRTMDITRKESSFIEGNTSMTGRQTSSTQLRKDDFQPVEPKKA
jgi:hypothetical protein